MPSHMRKFLPLRVLVVVEIGASGLRFGPWDWDSGFGARFHDWGWDISFDAGIWALRLELGLRAGFCTVGPHPSQA